VGVDTRFHSNPSTKYGYITAHEIGVNERWMERHPIVGKGIKICLNEHIIIITISYLCKLRKNK